MVLAHTWKNEAPDICGMRYTMRPNMSAIGIRRLLNIWQRNEPEGKHYNVAISHAIKKLVRVIYHLEKTNQQYIKS